MVRPNCLQTSLKCDAFLSHVDTMCRSALLAAASKVLSHPDILTVSSMSTFPDSSADPGPLSEIDPFPSSVRSSSSKVDCN